MHHLYASLLLFFLLIVSAHGQHAFQTLLPGLTPAQKRPTVQTSDGGFCILAEYMEEETSNYRLVLVKTTADGTIEWSRMISTAGLNDRPIALRKMPDGGFIVAAISSIPDSWNQDILVVRMSAHGDPIWSRTYDASELDWASDLVVLEDGSTVIVGSTNATDSAAARDEVAEEAFEEYDVYNEYYNERTFVLKIDAEGEVLWGGFLKETTQENGHAVHTIWKGFAEAVCRRNGNTVTLIEQAAEGYSFSNSIVASITEDGKASAGLIARGMGSEEEPISRPHINDIVSLPDGSCFITGNKRYYTADGETFDEGFLLRLNNENRLTWNKVFGGAADQFPMTISPIDDKRYLIAGRTIFIDSYASDIDNPLMSIIDQDGVPSESSRWMTTFEGLPTQEIEGYELKPVLWTPLFIPTDDQGVLSVGTILMRPSEQTYFYGGTAGMLVARFNPDRSTCGGDDTRTVDLHSAVAGETSGGVNVTNAVDLATLDVISTDYRTSSPHIASFDYAEPMEVLVEATDEHYGYGDGGMFVRDSVMDPGGVKAWEEAVEHASYGYYDTELIPQPDTVASSEWASDDSADQMVPTPPLPSIPAPYDEYSEVGSYGVVELLVDTAAYINYVEPDYSEVNVSPNQYLSEDQVTDTAYHNFGYGYGYGGDYEEEEEIDWENNALTFAPIDVTLVPLEVRSTLLTNVAVEELEFSPFFLCGDNSMIGSSSAPSTGQSVEAEYLHVLPNSIQKGKSVVVDFQLQSDEKPEVNLISVGLGEVVQRIDAKGITWSEAGGNGGATIETASLASGVYLVQVRSGEKQLTAKLEVR